MYSFVDKTWNPIKGECEHDCSYCFMKNMRRRFHQNPNLRLAAKELKTDLGCALYVFVGSSTDVFASNVPSEWIEAVLNHVEESNDNNTYQFQSKNPKRFLDFLNHDLFKKPNIVVFTTTVESDIDYPEVSKAPPMAERIGAMKVLSQKGFKTSITIEPIMKFSDAAAFAEQLASINPIQVNIGANTARGVSLPEPTKDEVEALIKELTIRGVSIHQKSNLARLLK